MKRTTYTYSALIILVFMRNIGITCKSKKKLIDVTDKLAQHLHVDINIAESTKYSIIQELIDSRILKKEKKSIGRPISLSRKAEHYMLQSIEKIVEVDEDGSE